MPLIKANNLPAGSVVFSMADIEQHARSILAQARAQATAQAQQILTQATLQAETLKKNATAQGKAAGLEQGRKEGRDQAFAEARNQALSEQKAKLIETFITFAKVVKEVDARVQALQQEARSELVPLALAIAKRVAHLSAERDPSVVQANVNEAVRLVMNKVSIRIAIHPTQKQAVDALLPQLKLQWPTMQQVELIEDPTLSTGGCRVFSAGGVIDADLETQIERIAKELACGSKDEGGGLKDDANTAAPAVASSETSTQPKP